MVRRHVIVRGEVQGVGFRWSARAEASRARVTGYVRNRDDGAVEAEVEGSPEAVGRMLAWFEHGPSGATVDSVEAREVPPTGDTAFSVR